MTELTTVFLDPDGTHDIGHYVLVLRQTGVRYEIQCGGLLCCIRGAEGFLVSVGPSRDAASLCSYVERRFRGYGHKPAAEWSAEDRDGLATRVDAVRVWVGNDDGEDRPFTLELDETRLPECMEAWIPVVTPYGAAWFLGPNSD